MSKNYFPQAIDVLINQCQGVEGSALYAILVEIAKSKPSEVVKAAERVRRLKGILTWENKCRILLASGHKIDAIKECCALTGWGLREAKEAVERL